MDSKYVAFSTDALRTMFDMIWSNTGSIVSIALYTSVMVLGVYIIVFIVNKVVLRR